MIEKILIDINEVIYYSKKSHILKSNQILNFIISCKYNIPLLLLRKEKKKYGTKQMIEGIIDKTKKVILIDDIITSGTSINESLEFFNQFEILDIITVIDREQSKKIENYNSLFTISEVFHFLKLSNLISKEQYDSSLEFVKNN